MIGTTLPQLAGRSTVGSLFRERARLHPDRCAVEAGGSTLTYGALNDRVNRAVDVLRNFGVARGDRGARPAGWCALAPRAEDPRLETSRVLAPVDARPMWSVVCFFVARPHRGKGLAKALLKAAVVFAARRGARIVEGYPVAPRARTADAFVWIGLATTFRAAGFREVARRSPTRPIMRYAVRGVSAAQR